MSNNLPKTKWFKYSLIIATVEVVLAGACFVLGFVSASGVLLSPNVPNSWDKLGDFFALVIIALLFGIAMPPFLSVLFGYKYMSGKGDKYLSSCKGSATASIFISAAIILLIANSSTTYGSLPFGNDAESARAIFITLSLLITEGPFIALIAGCKFEKGDKNAKSSFIIPATILLIAVAIVTVPTFFSGIGVKKIHINKSQLRTTSDFRQALLERGLHDDYDEDKLQYPSGRVKAAEAGYPYLREDEEGRFNFYIYDSYNSLIEKSPKTADYYAIGPDDWWVEWIIYESNGQIFAAISYESKLNSVRTESLFDKQSIQIVAEKKEITTYNQNGDYYVNNGCFVSTTSPSNSNMMSFPRMYDSGLGHKCANVYVVDRVDAKTLDELAKQIVK